MAGRKENLKALFTNTRTRVIIVFTAVLLLLAVIIGLVKFSKAIPEEAAPSAKVGTVPGIESLPGVLNQSPQYAKLQEDQNRMQAEDAMKSSNSVIPTIIRTQAIEGTGVVGAQAGESGVGFISLSQGNEEGQQKSLWLQNLKDANCSKESLDKVTTDGLELSKLVEACSCAQLKDYGYGLSDLERVCSCKSLKEAGFRAIDMKNIGYTAGQLRDCGFIACEMKGAAFSAQELVDGGFTEGEMKGAGYSDDAIAQAGGIPSNMRASDVQTAGCDVAKLTELRKAGVSAGAIRRISGCSSEALKQAGYTAAELKNAGFSAAELKRAGFSPSDLKQAGFTARELMNAGFTPEDLTIAGFTPQQIQAAEAELPPGISAGDVKKAGCDVDTLIKLRLAGVSAATIRKEAGCSLEALKAAGFTKANLMNAGFSEDAINKSVPITDAAITSAGCDPVKLKQLLALGVSAARIKKLNNCDAAALKNAGYPPDVLLDAGYTPEELKAAGFTDNEIATAGLNTAAALAKGRLTDCSPAALQKARAAGVSAQTIKNTLGCPLKALKDAGYSLKELKDAGYTAAELKNAGFSADDLKKAGFDAKALKEAGFTADELKRAGFNAKALKEAGFSPIQLKNAGFNAAQLKDAGFTAKELKDAGILVQDLKNAGFDAKTMLEAGFTPQQLKEAGFVIPGTSLAGAVELPEGATAVTVVKTPTTGAANSRLAAAEAALRANAENRSQMEKVLTDQNKRIAEQKLQDNISSRTSEMLTVANQYIQNWSQVDTQVYEAGTEVKTETTTISNVASISNNAAIAQNVQQQAPSAPVIKAGDIMYAVLETSVDSDEPGPILATIVSGRLKGTRLIGSFNLPSNAEKMIINFNTMSVPGATATTSINAYAIDPDTARTALSSRTDHHYLMRYGSLFASSFMEGLGNAIQTANTQITIGGTGGLTSTVVENSRPGGVTLENAVIALTAVGQAWGQQAQQIFNRPTTVQVFSGTAIGVLFMQDVTII